MKKKKIVGIILLSFGVACIIAWVQSGGMESVKHLVGLPLSEKSTAILFFGESDLQISGGGNQFSFLQGGEREGRAKHCRCG